MAPLAATALRGSLLFRDLITLAFFLKPSTLPARYVLEDAGPDALVLVDELGKGTEARAGTALAAALLEHLARVDARGIFATCAPPEL